LGWRRRFRTRAATHLCAKHTNFEYQTLSLYLALDFLQFLLADLGRTMRYIQQDAFQLVENPRHPRITQAGRCLAIEAVVDY
jgi:hypothetical protein